MAKKKNLDIAPSRAEKGGVGQIVLGFFLLIYTLICTLPVILVIVAAFTNEKVLDANGYSFWPTKLTNYELSADESEYNLSAEFNKRANEAIKGDKKFSVDFVIKTNDTNGEIGVYEATKNDPVAVIDEANNFQSRMLLSSEFKNKALEAMEADSAFSVDYVVNVNDATKDMYISEANSTESVVSIKTIITKPWSMNGVNSVLRYGQQLAYSYGVTLIVTVVGTFFGLLVMSMFAYSISRKDFRLSRFLSIYLLIPMLFNGGTLSGYMIFSNYYHLKDTLIVLILPLCVSTMNVIILRTYIANSIPNELMEAAMIDGAGEYRTFFQITLPLLKPSLAAVGFMMATAYWNDWQNALLYIDDAKKKPLQLLLVSIQNSIDFLLNNNNVPSSARDAMGGMIPKQSATMATVLIVTGPIMVAYPFFQKYFIKGLTVGSVKG